MNILNLSLIRNCNYKGRFYFKLIDDLKMEINNNIVLCKGNLTIDLNEEIHAFSYLLKTDYNINSKLHIHGFIK